MPMHNEQDWTREQLIARVQHLEWACSTMNAEIEQVLAQAIGGYPWYCDDQKNFPGATQADGVCVGEHVAESLAMEAATLIKKLRAEAKTEEDYWYE